MERKLFFLGTLYPPQKEKTVKSLMTRGVSDAPNVFQWNLINGLSSCIDDKEKFEIVSVLPVGTWPKAYKQLFLKDDFWEVDGVKGREVGSINIPFLKQFFRACHS